VPPCVGQLIALSIAGNSFGSRRKLRRELFSTRDYVGSYVEYDVTVTFPRRGYCETTFNANENGTKTLFLLHVSHLLLLVSPTMAIKDSIMDSCGRLKGSILSKSCVCPGAVTLMENISTAVDQGIFTTIVECTAEWITVTYPKMIQD
jgi:hypothetical protein